MQHGVTQDEHGKNISIQSEELTIDYMLMKK